MGNKYKSSHSFSVKPSICEIWAVRALARQYYGSTNKSVFTACAAKFNCNLNKWRVGIMKSLGS